jgi:poly-gamma-glutamate synthesis protein (capsule biosynthesis protein)
VNPFVLAATGDTLVTRRLSTLGEPAFARVVALLRSADAAFTNLETTIHDGAGHPSAQSGGTWMVAPAYAVDELHWAGLRLLARANNHALDWAVEGMRATTRLLDAQGLTHAGVGEDLAAAREPAYRDTPGGRVALVSAASTFPEWSRAGHARKDVRGRPGLNPLRWAKVHLLSPQAFRAMQGIAAEVGIVANDPGQAIHLFDTVFVPWQSTGAGVEAFPQDLAGNLASVRAARAHADIAERRTTGKLLLDPGA